MRILLIKLVFLATFTPGLTQQQQNSIQMLGFEITDPLIPVEEIKEGGPPRDGIPSIDQPRFLPADEYTFFDDDSRVLGVSHNGISKAYPIAILNWHEIVNDRFGPAAVAITYCPLCGSGLAFDAQIDGTATEFGVSGLLYNSDVLLYDRNSESLWSQIRMQCISGMHKGKKLNPIATANTTLGKWKEMHPNTQILTTQTGYTRNYERSPYGAYAEEKNLYFPVSHEDDRFHPKELVLGLEVDGVFKAYPFSQLAAYPELVLEDEVNGQKVFIQYDLLSDSAIIRDEAGGELPAITLYWFAWVAFHPETEVFIN